MIKKFFKWLWADGYCIGFKTVSSLATAIPEGNGVYHFVNKKVYLQTCKHCQKDFYASKKYSTCWRLPCWVKD
jgi:hypothetical protein